MKKLILTSLEVAVVHSGICKERSLLKRSLEVWKESLELARASGLETKVAHENIAVLSDKLAALEAVEGRLI